MSEKSPSQQAITESLYNLLGVASALCETPYAMIQTTDGVVVRYTAPGDPEPLKDSSPPLPTFSELTPNTPLCFCCDTSLDERFANHPLVCDYPQIRFLVEVGLYPTTAELATDEPLAVLSLYDTKPRTLTAAQQRNLYSLISQGRLTLELWKSVCSAQSRVEALGESERRFRTIADASPMLLWIADDAGNRTFFNKAWCEFTGLSREDSVADLWIDAIHPDDREPYLAYCNDVVQRREQCQHEFRLRHTSGTYRWMLEQTMPMRSTSGRIEGYVSSCLDLSSRNAEELQYQSNEARFRAISEAAPLGIFVTDAHGNCVYTNHQFQRILGRSSEECLGSAWLKAIDPQDADRVMRLWRNATTNVTPFEDIHRYRRADGTISWCSVKAAAINATDAVSGWVATVEDITARLTADEELRTAKQTAEAAVIAKGQFLANMSHEIRTPLTAIIGFAESLRDEGSRSEQDLFSINAILKNGQHLLEVINDILDLSKIDAGAMTIESCQFHLVPLVEEVRAMFTPRMREKSLDLHVVYHWPVPLTITSDPLRIKQVLINLLSNAIKFTHSGSITVEISYQRDGNKVVCCVTDSGIGMSPEQKARLFQPFSQANESITRKYGGTGLGLTICQWLVSALGGTIEVTSEEGHGSRFSFSITPTTVSDEECIAIPARSSEALPQKLDPVQLHGRVLFADDAVDNRNLLRHILSKMGLDTVLVEDGKQAIETTLNEPFDLIILDIQMPILDGLNAARALRCAGIVTPIIALSAGATSNDEERSAEAGCSAYLPKPFTREAFYQLLSKYLPNNEDHETIAGVPAMTNLQTPIISTKIVEDPDMLPLLTDYVTGLPGRIEEILTASNENDADKLRLLAHKMKGSAGLYGFPELHTLAARLEQHAREAAIGNIPADIHEIEDLVARIQMGLN